MPCYTPLSGHTALMYIYNSNTAFAMGFLCKSVHFALACPKDVQYLTSISAVERKVSVLIQCLYGDGA